MSSIICLGIIAISVALGVPLFLSLTKSIGEEEIKIMNNIKLHPFEGRVQKIEKDLEKSKYEAYSWQIRDLLCLIQTLKCQVDRQEKEIQSLKNKLHNE